MSERVRGDADTDRLYSSLRDAARESDTSANGYRYRGYFEREQALLLELLDPRGEIVLDVACGSGLMLAPLLGRRALVFGVELNALACRAAHANGFPVVRGDAFVLPLTDGCVDEITCCQFFNQQRPEAVAAFLGEAARVLRPGGRAVLVWRNAGALVHRAAHAVLGTLDRLRGRPSFPQYRHDLTTIASTAGSAGLDEVLRLVSCPPLGWRTDEVAGLAARVLGASNVLVVRKPGDAPAD